MTRAAALVLALAACGGHEAAPVDEEAVAVQVRCVAASSAPHADTTELRGTIAPPPRATSVVAAPVPGRIARLLVEEGDVVAAGALIAVLDDPGLGASAAESGAEVAAAEAELRAATADRTRRERLVGQGIAPQKDLDEARAREDAARARVTGAGARRQLARGNLARAELRAAHGGTVLHVLRRAGDVVDAAAPSIAELADLSVLELRAQVTGGELIGLETGGAATVVLDALPAVELPAQVVAVAPALDGATSLGTVRVQLIAPPGLHLAVGLAGVARVARPARTALTVPAGAVRRSIEGRDEVLVCAGPPLHAEVRAVVLHRRPGEVVEIVSGVAAGERVIVDHVLTLEDGAALAESAPGSPR